MLQYGFSGPQPNLHEVLTELVHCVCVYVLVIQTDPDPFVSKRDCDSFTILNDD